MVRGGTQYLWSGYSHIARRTQEGSEGRGWSGSRRIRYSCSGESPSLDPYLILTIYGFRQRASLRRSELAATRSAQLSSTKASTTSSKPRLVLLCSFARPVPKASRQSRSEATSRRRKSPAAVDVSSCSPFLLSLLGIPPSHLAIIRAFSSLSPAFVLLVVIRIIMQQVIT